MQNIVRVQRYPLQRTYRESNLTYTWYEIKRGHSHCYGCTTAKWSRKKWGCRCTREARSDDVRFSRGILGSETRLALSASMLGRSLDLALFFCKYVMPPRNLKCHTFLLKLKTTVAVWAFTGNSRPFLVLAFRSFLLFVRLFFLS